MENESSTIHDFDLNIICEYFSGLERQGPGSPDVTLKALSQLQVQLQDDFLKKYSGNAAAEDLVAYMWSEVEMYEKYGNYYGYVFFIGKKIKPDFVDLL